MNEAKKTEFIDPAWKTEFERLLNFVHCSENIIILRVQQLDVFLKMNNIRNIVNDLIEIVNLDKSDQTGFEDLFDIENWVRTLCQI